MEFKKEQGHDQETQTAILSFMDQKMDNLTIAMDRIDALERKLSVKHEGSSPHDEFHTRKTAKPVQLPPRYDGNTLWEAYNAQFEIVSQLNGWSKDEKSLFLATSLIGNATTILSNLSEESRGDYNILRKTLSNRFGAAHQT